MAKYTPALLHNIFGGRVKTPNPTPNPTARIYAPGLPAQRLRPSKREFESRCHPNESLTGDVSNGVAPRLLQ